MSRPMPRPSAWHTARPASTPSQAPATPCNCSTLAATRISKKIAPDQPGAQRWRAKYGDSLLCVRYRDDPTHGRRLVTVELLVEERLLPVRQPRPDEAVMVRIHYNETQLMARAKAYGGRWDPEARRWRMTRDQATQAGLADRIQASK